MMMIRALLYVACASAGLSHAQAVPASGQVPGSAHAALPLVEAEVRKVDPARSLIVLRHGELPNLAMPPMTMGFGVAHSRMLQQVKVGDKVRFQAEMISGRATITQLEPARP